MTCHRARQQVPVCGHPNWGGCLSVPERGLELSVSHCSSGCNTALLTHHFGAKNEHSAKVVPFCRLASCLSLK